MLASPVTGSDVIDIDNVFDGDSQDGEWDLNKVGSTPGGAVAVCAGEMQGRFTIVQEIQSTAGLRAHNTISDLLFELVKTPVIATTFSTLDVGVFLSVRITSGKPAKNATTLAGSK